MSGNTRLDRTSPEAEGISSMAVLDFIRAIERHPSHPLDAVQGFMLLRYGNVAAEGFWTPYGPDFRHTLYSLSKSFTSSAIGLAVSEGLLTVDDPVLKFFPEEAPDNPGENLNAMLVRHLLSMNTGHQEDTTFKVFQDQRQLSLFGLGAPLPANPLRPLGDEGNSWARLFLSLPVENPPGSWFVYNTAATYMLSAIITKLTGESLLDYLRPRLFEPLGIKDPSWETDPHGINLGGTGLNLKMEDIARFGQMLLQKGMWEGQRILPEEWVAEATRVKSDNSNTETNPDWSVGYGYQFWRCRHNGYRGDGAFGQFCIVMPEQDVVLVMVAGLQNMQAVLDMVWEYLLPDLGIAALPADPKAHGLLQRKLASLSLPLVAGQSTSPVVYKWSGKTFRLKPNEFQFESAGLRFDGDSSTLLLCDERGEHLIRAGNNQWLRGTTDLRVDDGEPIAACGAWIEAGTFEMRICFIKNVFCPVLRFHFAKDELLLEVNPNVIWGPADAEKITVPITGKSA